MMADLLVRLLDLPETAVAAERAGAAGFTVRRALAPERHVVVPWVKEHFAPAWASECEVAFARQPLACFLATREDQLCGFAVYEATCRNFFGPLGVHPEARGTGVGTALLVTALNAMRAEGYAYAIIGGAGPTIFFEQAVGATLIDAPGGGIYRGMLR